MSYCYCVVADREHWHRKDLLVNCVGSIRRYDRTGTVVVFGEEWSRELLRDNNLLDDNTRFITSVKGAGGQKGPVFIDMDGGLQFARDNGMEYVFFVFENMQLIRDPRPMLASAAQMFGSRQNLSMVSGICMDGSILPNWPAATDWREDPSEGFLESDDYAMFMAGVVSVNRIDQAGFRFGNGTERGINNWWTKRGYKLLLGSVPVMSYVPWVSGGGSENDLPCSKLLLEAKEPTRIHTRSDWHEQVGFSNVKPSEGARYWRSPERYAVHRRSHNPALSRARRMVHRSFPRDLRYFFLMMLD